jgi:hypothetical protein
LKKLIFFLFLFYTSCSLAQEFNGGLRVGIAGSQVNGDRLSGFDKGGIIFGGFVNRKLSEHFNAQMEIVYIQKGSRKPTDQMTNTFYLLRLNYIEVPLMLHWFVSKKIALTAGPSVGTLIGSHEENEYQVFESGSQFKKFELSANAGIIYRLSDKWNFDGRYSASLSTIRPFPGVSTAFFDQGQYNIVIEFSLLYSF